MRLEVFGKDVEVTWHNDCWRVYYVGTEGKKRLAEDITIPAEIKQESIPLYLADLCHEWARTPGDGVKISE